MISRTVSLSATAFALALASCAEPPAAASNPPPTVKKPVVAGVPKPEPEPMKSAGMNHRGKVTSMSLEEFFPLQESGKVILFDARPGFFYNLGHIPGAISLPKSGMDERLAQRKSEFDAAAKEGKAVVIYCTNLLCPDARAVAMRLADFGYSSSVLSGGWETYKETGLPTE